MADNLVDLGDIEGLVTEPAINIPETKPKYEDVIDDIPDTPYDNDNDNNPFDKQTDDHGNVFDPNVHATDDHGNPKLTKTGKFRKKRGANQGDNSRINIPRPQSELSVDVAHASMAVTALFITGGQMFFGEEWKPESEAEQNALNKAFYDYFKAKGLGDLPPGVALACALGMYTSKRLAKPTTSQRISYALGWITGKIGRIFKGGSRSNNRSNKMWQKHAGKGDHQKEKSGWRSRVGL